MNQYLKILYEKAIEIEKNSQSPRLKILHDQGLFCEVGLGTYYPETTKYMFVSLNPGGEYYHKEAQEPEKSSSEHLPFTNYLEYKFPYARNMKKIILAFAESKSMLFNDASKLFGTTDLSFFHSRNSTDLKESFFIEVKESLPIFLEELSIPHLKGIIFSGVPQHHFFYNLYKVKAPIVNYLYKNKGQDRIISFNTTLINDRNYHCLFVTHLSATRGLRNQTLMSIGSELAKLFN